MKFSMRVRLVAILAVLLLTWTSSAWAVTVGDFELRKTDGEDPIVDTDYRSDGNSLHILSDIPMIVSGTVTTGGIVVEAADAKLTLENLSIASNVPLQSNSNLTLTLSGTNRLLGTEKGIRHLGLTINGNGSLVVENTADDEATISGGSVSFDGSITVTATAKGRFACGIDCHSYSIASGVTLNTILLEQTREQEANEAGTIWVSGTVKWPDVEELPPNMDLKFLENAILKIEEPLHLNNAGTIHNTGTINIDSTLTNLGNIVNNGIINNNSANTLNNQGTLTNNGTLNNAATGKITNTGTIDNASGTITNAGTIDNTGGTIKSDSADFSGNEPTGNPVTPVTSTPPTDDDNNGGGSDGGGCNVGYGIGIMGLLLAGLVTRKSRKA